MEDAEREERYSLRHMDLVQLQGLRLPLGRMDFLRLREEVVEGVGATGVVAGAAAGPASAGALGATAGAAVAAAGRAALFTSAAGITR